MLNEGGERVMTSQRMCTVISSRDFYDDVGVACTVARPKARTEPHMAGGNTLVSLFLRPGDDRRFEKI
jgi:hypothetical protein